MIYMFLSNNPSSGDINSSNLPCYYFKFGNCDIKPISPIFFRKLIHQDRRAEPRTGERIPYVIVYGSPGLPLIQLVRQPMDLIQDGSLRLNSTYYITKQILPPLNRFLSLLGVDVFSWWVFFMLQ